MTERNGNEYPRKKLKKDTAVSRKRTLFFVCNHWVYTQGYTLSPRCGLGMQQAAERKNKRFYLPMECPSLEVGYSLLDIGY